MNISQSLIERAGTGIEKNGTGIEKNGTGIEKNGTGIEKNGTGIEKYGARSSGFRFIRTSFVAALAAAMMLGLYVPAAFASSQTKAQCSAFMLADDGLVTISMNNANDALLGSAVLQKGYGVSDLYVRIGGAGTGQKIGGAGTGQKIGGAGTGQKIGGAGTGQKIGGAGTGQKIGGAGTGEKIVEDCAGFRIGGAGTGQKIGGAGTGQKIGGAGTGQKIGGAGTGARVALWGRAEVLIDGDIASVILYQLNKDGALNEHSVFQIPVLRN